MSAQSTEAFSLQQQGNRDKQGNGGGGTEKVTATDEGPGGDVVVVKKNPVDILPEEVWLIILKLLGAEDANSCYHTCKIFRTLLTPRRTLFMFPLVLPFLELELVDVDDFNAANHNPADFVACRRVCRTWKTALDCYCHSLDYFDENGENDEWFPTYKFYSNLEMTSFKEKMDSRPFPRRNPFVTRRVAFADELVQVHEEAVIDEYWSGVATFLKDAGFGTHVWYAEFVVGTRKLWATLYRMLFGFCSGLPNVRVLTLTRLFFAQDEPADESTLEEYCTRWPLPEMPSVVEANISLFPPDLMKLLLNALPAAKLESLTVDSKVDCVSVASRFTNLKRVDLSIFRNSTLRTLRSVGWPLTEATFTVKLWRPPASARITFFTLFQWLSQFGGTLVKLHLVLYGSSGHNTGWPVTLLLIDKSDLVTMEPDLRLRLPCLEKLHIEVNECVNVNSLDFMETLKSLDTFHLQMPGSTFEKEEKPDETIKFSGRAAHMLRSNLWEACPRLRYMTMQDKTVWYKYIWRGSVQNSEVGVVLPETNEEEVIDNLW